MALELPESGHTGLGLAPAHYPNQPTRIPECPIKKALEIFKKRKAGISSSELSREVHRALPNEAENSVRTIIGILPTLRPDDVYKPVRGQLRLIAHRDNTAIQPQRTPEVITAAQQRREEAFYEPFAKYLVEELEECTTAFPVGGNLFRGKWGTPDVIGILESKRSDVIPFPTEVVSAEMKVDTNQLITAFGQACAYKLFSHRTYIVVPKTAPKEDIDRLDALCLIFGIGFILFDSTSSANPVFEIKVRAAKHEPDRFYVNENMKLINW